MEGKKQKIKLGRRLLMFPLPLKGHVTPMLHLATFLHSKGFSITIIHTRYSSPDPTNFPHFTFHFIEDGLSDKADDPPPGRYSHVFALNKSCSEPFRDCLSQLLGSDQDCEPVSCLIADPMWQFAGAVADSFNLHRIVLGTGCLSAFLVYESLPLLRQLGYFLHQETKSNELVVELPPLKVKDLPIEPIHEMLAVIVKEIKTSQGIVCNTFEELESSSLATVHQALPIPVFPVGPLHRHQPTPPASSTWAQDEASISWLNTQVPNSVLYVSFGSLAKIDEAEFQEIAWGLANSMQPFLWVVRQGLVRGSEADESLPEGYLDTVGERGRIVKWAQQLEVLAHPAVGGFWTHCGWNSIVESITEGVPMICLPLFADQALNARHVSDNWRVGLQLEKGVKTREEIEKAIREVMVEEEGEEMRNRAATLKQKAMLCLMEGGSSSESLENLTSYVLSF